MRWERNNLGNAKTKKEKLLCKQRNYVFLMFELCSHNRHAERQQSKTKQAALLPTQMMNFKNQGAKSYCWVKFPKHKENSSFA